MYRFFLITLLLLLLIGCSDSKKDGNVKVKATIDGIKGSKVILIVENPNSPDGYHVDSLVAAKNYIEFAFDVDTLRVAALMIDSDKSGNFDDNSAPKMPVQFFAEPGKTVEIEGKSTQLHLARLKGSTMNQQMDSLNRFLWEKQLAFDNYVNLYQEMQLKGEESLSMRDSLRNAFVGLINEYKRFVAIHSDWDITPFIISTYLSQYVDSGELNELFNLLSERVKNTHYGTLLKDYLSGFQFSDEFELAPDFSLTDKDNQVVKLSDFKGRYLLISFWGSWCKPCRDSHPYFVEAVREYRKKGLQILGIAADKDHQAWLQAIKEDKLDWPQVNALEQTHIDILSRFSVRAFPTKVIIDPEGKIIARFVGDDPQMYEALKQIYP